MHAIFCNFQMCWNNFVIYKGKCLCIFCNVCKCHLKFPSIPKSIFIRYVIVISMEFVFLQEKLCKLSYSSMECLGACTPATDDAASSGALVRREKCSCGKSTATRRSVTKRGSYKQGQSLTQMPWRPLLLFIPLRLGLSEVNPTYYRGLKVCWTCTVYLFAFFIHWKLGISFTDCRFQDLSSSVFSYKAVCSHAIRHDLRYLLSCCLRGYIYKNIC